MALALCTSGCASWLLPDTTPLPPDRLEPVGSFRISHGGYRLGALPASPDTPDMLVIVAISGGGKRSASFGWGALEGMRDVMVPTGNGPRPLLSEVDTISGVYVSSYVAISSFNVLYLTHPFKLTQPIHSQPSPKGRTCWV